MQLIGAVEGCLQVGQQAEGAAVRGVAVRIVPRPAFGALAAVLRGGQSGAQALGAEGLGSRGHLGEADADASIDGYIVADQRACEGTTDAGDDRGLVGVAHDRQHADEAEDADVIEPRAGADDLAQPVGAGADEGFGAVMSERPEDRVERARAGQRDQQDRRRAFGGDLMVLEEAAAVRPSADRIE